MKASWDNQRIWEDALVEIRRRVTAENYSTYFRPLRLVCIAPPAPDASDAEAPIIVLEVDDAFFGDWVQAHYADLIDSAVSQAGGRPHRVEIRTAMAPTAEHPVGIEPDSRPAPATLVERQPMASSSMSSFPLNPQYTFETFVVGPANEMGHAASRAVADEPARAYNPLFIYGGTGLGKTHLLHAIAHQLRARDPSVRIAYLSAEEFTNQVIKSIQRQEMDAFRARYRSECDVLLMDDVQVLAGKERTQEELFYTFNALHGAQKQIVLTSDKTPQEIPHLEERLRSRFQWGLITDIKAPQFETRVAILQCKAERDGIDLPDEVAFYLARLVRANVRELEGALIRLSAYASLRQRKMTIAFAEEALRDVIESRGRALTVDSIIKMVAEHFDVKSSDLRGSRRHRVVSYPRGIAMYLCRKHTQASYPQIGRGFGGKDHSTVMAACRKIEKKARVDQTLRAELDALERKLPI